MMINPIDLRLAERDVEALIDAVMDQQIRWETRLRLAKEKYARSMTPVRRIEVEAAERRLELFDEIYARLLRAYTSRAVDNPS